MGFFISKVCIMSLFSRSELKSKAQQKYGANSDLISRFELGVSTKIYEAFKTTIEHDIFLSHSYLDADEIVILKQEFESSGFSVYVDWIDDTQLSRNQVTKDTANQIRYRLKNCKCLIYAFSENSPRSKWMPWELGLSDGHSGKAAVLPITDTTRPGDDYSGVEFIGIYPYVVKTSGTFWIHDDAKTYVQLTQWLQSTR